MLVGGAAAAVIAISLAVMTMWRVQEARDFGQAHFVRTYAGTNYVVQLTETAIGRTDSGYVLLVHLRLRNPNPFELPLNRNAFILVDHDKDYYLPTTSGTQTELIKIPANGVLDNEMLSFAVPEDSLDGTVALQVGHHYMVLLKDEEPFGGKLSSGEFRVFRRRNW